MGEILFAEAKCESVWNVSRSSEALSSGKKTTKIPEVSRPDTTSRLESFFHLENVWAPLGKCFVSDQQKELQKESGI